MKRHVLAICIVLFCPLLGRAAITFDAATATTQQSAASSITFSHTTAVQSNRVLIVFCLINDTTSSTTVTGITYNSVAMTNIGTVGSSIGDNSYISVYKLAAPSTGANNVVASLDANDGFSACAAETWYDVDQSTINRAASSRTSGTTTETSSSLTPTSQTNDMVLDVIGWRYAGQGTITIGGGQTERFNVDGGAGASFFKGSSETGGSGTTTMDWSWATAGWTPDSQFAFSLIPATAAGGPASGSLTLLGAGK